MHEILDHLPNGARVLDLGARDGSYPLDRYPHLHSVRVDLKAGAHTGPFVRADAARLPFPSRAFDAVILNHCLEHFVDLKPSLQEIGRVVKRDGAVYVAVPDARTLTDRIYRKAYADAGGHVNLFGSESELIGMLSWYFGLPHVATRVLYSSLAFLNSRNTKDIAVRRQMRFPPLWEPILRWIVAILRVTDRYSGSRAGGYGWALYFGATSEPVDRAARVNVCIRCGQAHASNWLADLRLVRKHWIGWPTYPCPDCGAVNFYFNDSVGGATELPSSARPGFEDTRSR